MKSIPIQPSPSVPAKISFRWLLAAPHRLFFFTASFQLISALVFWAFEHVQRGTGLLPQWHAAVMPVLPMTSGLTHAFTLIFGALAGYMFGFGFTALPRWLSRSSVDARTGLPIATLQTGGTLLLLTGWAATGLALLLAAWSICLGQLWRKVMQGPHHDKRHAWLVFAALVIGWIGLALANLGVWSNNAGLLRAALLAAFWGMLLPVNLVVSHRMLPFFTHNAMSSEEPWRPFVPLCVLLAAIVIYAAAAQASMHWLAALAAAAGSVLSGLFAWRWHVRGIGKNRLLAMLHIAHAWLPVGLAMAAVQSAGALAEWYVLGLAPLHAIAIGFALSMAIAMVSRVTLGHSGRHLSADRVTWILFLGLQLVCGARIAADILPPSQLTQPVLLAGAGSAACLLLIWGYRYMPIYLKPRPDGMPG